jgi:8-oxo-dGTP pyrophosphatase MutT (NUDIX family)
MADFGGPAEYTTWDGEPVSRERPHGATIVVAAHCPAGWRYLLLHRGHRGRDFDGDWAWTPPAGSRKPGEDVLACAARELHEETGLTAKPRTVRTGDTDWSVFAVEVPSARRCAD